MSDELALGALRAAQQAGIAIPGALSITGWDDSDAASAPGITILAQSLHDQGVRCAQLALGKATLSQGDDRAAWQIIHRSSTRASSLRKVDAEMPGASWVASTDDSGRPHRSV